MFAAVLRPPRWRDHAVWVLAFARTTMEVRTAQINVWSVARSPDEAKRNPGQTCQLRHSRISLRCIRATISLHLSPQERGEGAFTPQPSPSSPPPTVQTHTRSRLRPAG